MGKGREKWLAGNIQHLTFLLKLHNNLSFQAEYSCRGMTLNANLKEEIIL